MNSSPTLRILILALALAGFASLAAAEDSDSDSGGLRGKARNELRAAGVDKYLGQFTPALSVPVGDGWVKHTFDPAGGAGPICIAGTPFSVFTRPASASGGSDDDSDSDSDSGRKLLIMLQGGGACWQDFYNCNVVVETPTQQPPPPPVGIWDFASPLNPFAGYSIVYMPYCDGSVFTGDNDVFDPDFGVAIGVPEVVVRFHRGLRNLSAGMDVARAMFPKAKKITVAGSSAGGVGAAGFAPFLARFLYKNRVDLTVFNDAGPVTVNLGAVDDVTARANDWQFGQFYPASCTACSDMGQTTEIIKWRLDNDTNVRESLYQTDADLTNRFFLGLLADPVGFRNLIVTEHGLINLAHPDRYKRFIVAGDTSHTALQTPLLYFQDANGVLLDEWTAAFLEREPAWVDLVEDP